MSKDEMVNVIERALNPGAFISYKQSWDFMLDLGRTKDRLDTLASDDPERAVELYELFLSGCYDKAEEIDDSSGGLGDFFQELFLGWVKTRRQAKCDAQETVKQILAWIENDNYGFMYEIEQHVAAVLAKPEYRLFVQHFEIQFNNACHGLEKKDRLPIYKYSNAFRLPAMTLREIYSAKKDARSYLKLLEYYACSPKDSLNLANIFHMKKKYAEALDWVKNGLALEKQSNWANETAWGLKALQQKLLHKAGRTPDALHAAWDEFYKQPSDYSYDNFMTYVPASERKAWHAKAMTTAAKGDLCGFMQLCVKTKEWQPLAKRVVSLDHPELESLSHFVMEGAAKGLERQFKPQAAKVYRALGMRIVNRGKSKYYVYALEHLCKARQCYSKSGLQKEWDSLVNFIREHHSRKYSFIGEFESIVSGAKPGKSETFEAKAKQRWKKQTTA
jgi:hypothetical protein